MKTLLGFLLLLDFMAVPLRAEPPAKPAPIPALPVGKRVFLDATVRKLDAFTARIAHSDGTATVPAWELPADAQRKAGFDPAATAAECQRRMEAVRAAADAKAEAEHRESARIAAAAAQKEEEARIAQAETEKREREEIAARRDEQEAREILERALKDPASLRSKVGLSVSDERLFAAGIRQLQEWNPAIAKAEQAVAIVRSNNLLVSRPEDMLAATGWERLLRDRGGRRLKASEFEGYSEESRFQILFLVPALAPVEFSPLGRLQQARDELESKMAEALASVIRKRRMSGADPSRQVVR